MLWLFVAPLNRAFVPEERTTEDGLSTGNIQEKQTVTQCSKLGENGETVMVSVLTEESHSSTTTGKWEIL